MCWMCGPREILDKVLKESGFTAAKTLPKKLAEPLIGRSGQNIDKGLRYFTLMKNSQVCVVKTTASMLTYADRDWQGMILSFL